MPIALGFAVQLAFFCFGTFRLGTILYRWLLHPRESVVRVLEDYRADPPGAAEREGMQAGILAPAAIAAWLWADLRFVWLFVAVLLGLSALSGFRVAKRMRETPALADARRSTPVDAELDVLAVRGQRFGATTSGVGLVLWLYSWGRPLRAMWHYLSTSPAL